MLITMEVSATGQSSLRELTLGFFRTGMIVLLLKHEGTTDNSRERLNMSVETCASTSAAWCRHEGQCKQWYRTPL